jgi:hypothetical protein
MTQNYLSTRTLYRGQTRELWKHYRGSEIRENFDAGYGFKDDFNPFVVGYYTKSDLNSATSTFAAVSGEGGLVRMDPGAVTAHHGCQVQFGTTTNPGYKPAASRDIYIEFLLRATTISTSPKIFLGFSTANVASYSAGSALNGTNMLGFSVSASGIVDLVGKVSGTTTTKTGLLTLTDDGWCKLGLHIKGISKVIPYVNGVQMATKSLPAAAIAAAIMTPTFANVAQGTVRPTLDLNWWEVGCNHTQLTLSA